MRSSNGQRLALLALFGLVVGGCSAPVVDDVVSATGSTTEAIVLVERSAAEGGIVQTNVSAKFMRLSSGADPDLAERVVGGSWLDLPAPGECMFVAPFGAAEEPALSGLGSIELLDVGDLTIQAGSKAVPLAARAFPDLGALVSGVFYTSRDARSDLPAPARYVLESTGSGSLDRFTIEAEAPAAPEDVRVGDVSFAEGVVLEEGVGAVVRWRAGQTEARKSEADVVYVDLTTASGTGIRCSYSDTGEGAIPASFVGGKAWGALPATATISVHRVRQGSFTAGGIDAGELRFDLSVVGRATIVSAAP
jgi:hypothetical protein